MNKLLLTALLFYTNSFICQTTHAPSFVFGQPTAQDWQYTKFEPLPQAAAVVLYEYTRVTQKIDKGKPFYVTEKKVRIKMLSKSGLENANITILYFSKKNIESVKGIKGKTLNKNDGIVTNTEIESSDIFEEEQNGLTQKKLAFRNVQVGSIIDYEYNLERESFQSIPTVYLQQEIPVLKSEVVFDILDMLTFNHSFIACDRNFVDEQITKHKVLLSADKYEQTLPGNSKKYVFDNILPFEDEPYMYGTRRNHMQRIESKILMLKIPGNAPRIFDVDWIDIGLSLSKNAYFGGQASKKLNAKDLEKQIVADQNNKQALLYEIVNYIRNNIDWNGKRSIGTSSVSDVWKDKSGTDGGINLMTINLLKQYGFYANPLLTATHDFGIVMEQLPDEDQFNKTLVHVKVYDSTYIFDAADKFTPINILPLEVNGANALVVYADSVKWLTLDENFGQLEQHILINAQVTDDAKMIGQLFVKNYGYERVNLLKEKAQKLLQEKTDIKETIKLKPTDLGEAEHETDFIKQKSTLVPKALDKTEDLYLLNLSNYFPIQKQLFKSNKRLYDINFFAKQYYKLFVKVSLPAGFTLAQELKSQGMKSDDGSFSINRNFTVADNEIFYTIELLATKSIYPLRDYPMIKIIYGELTKLLNEPIVLKKL